MRTTPTDYYEAYRYRIAADDRSGEAFVRFERAAANSFARAYVIPALRRVEEGPVLEIGAGAGLMVETLRSHGFGNVRGVDVSEYQVGIARKLGTGVELGDALGTLSAQPPGSLAAIVAIDVLEHLTRHEFVDCLNLARRSLRSGGALIIRVPNGGGLFGGAIRYGDITHAAAFTVTSLRDAMMLAGFAEVTTAPCRPTGRSVASCARRFAWRAVEAALWAANAAEIGQIRGAIFTRNLAACARAA